MPTRAGGQDRSTPSQRKMLLLWGFMGSGKSTIGRLVARRAGAGFVDLDDRIEEAAGVDVATLFEDRGESAFRELERRQLALLLDGDEPTDARRVVALGGGTLLDPLMRARALDEVYVVTLSVTAETIAARTMVETSKHDGPSPARRRPLLEGADPGVDLAHLLKQRAAAYEQAHTLIATDGRTPEWVAEQVLGCWWARGSTHDLK